MFSDDIQYCSSVSVTADQTRQFAVACWRGGAYENIRRLKRTFFCLSLILLNISVCFLSTPLTFRFLIFFLLIFFAWHFCSCLFCFLCAVCVCDCAWMVIFCQDADYAIRPALTAIFALSRPPNTTHLQTYAHAYIHVHAYVHTYIYAIIHANMYACIHSITYKYAFINTHTYMHTYII